jgi:hypothetical protein
MCWRSPAPRSACSRPADGTTAPSSPTCSEWPYNAPHRAAGTKEKPFGYFDATLLGGWQVPGEPYTNAPARDWMWWRARMLGGRTNHYGRISLRMGPYDFKPYSRDGKGFDWPITYDDLAPYYDKAEELIGVFGTPRGPREYARRQVSAGARAARLRAAGQAGLRQAERSVHPVAPGHSDAPIHGRPACHYCAQCGRACGVNANFNSPGVHIFPAMKTGNLEVRTGAMAREVVVGPDGLARGVSYIDKKTRAKSRSTPRSWCWPPVAAKRRASCSIPRAASFPTAWRTPAGLVGRYLMDTVGSDVGGYLPILEDLPPRNEDGVGGMHMYMPWWLTGAEGRQDAVRARLSHRVRRRARPAGAGDFGGSERILGGGYGVELKRNMRKMYGANIGYLRARRNDPQ